jgi:ABC-type nitrate/sulfonate/bicarbonate transport system substrate-binding protein
LLATLPASAAAPAGTAGNEEIFPMVPLRTRRELVAGSRTPAANETVRIATGIRATLQSLGWLGTQIGVFRRLGIDVTFPGIEVGGPQAASGLCDGDWEFCETGMAPAVQAVLDGHDTVIILAPTRPHVTGYILTRREIKEPAALANKRIGVLTETGQFAIATQLMLRQSGVTATLVPLGSFQTIYAALRAGSIEAAYFTLDYRIRAERELDANAFAGPASLGNQVLATTRRLIDRTPDLVARIVRGYVESIHWFKTDRAAVVPLLQQFLQFTDPRSVEDIYDFFMPTFQEVPRPTEEGIRALLEQLVAKYPAAQTLTPSQVTDTSFLDELEKNGFIARLYQKA